jgi:phenylalanyl-tRNA synthetase beta chain
MKFTLSWLKDHLDTSASVEDIATRLTALGLEVESVENRAEKLKPFVIAHVLEARPHPNADRLQVCKVDTGSGTMEVVCGAPNARGGMKGVYAPTGSYIPGSDFTLKPTKIRGVESAGMLCSERELLLSDNHEGIIELPDDAPVGANFAAYAGLDDPVIDIAITPNRPDCLGVAGVARDLAAAGLGQLKTPAIAPVAGAFKSPLTVRMDLPADKAHVCPLFVGRYIRGVKNGPSPKWLQDRLRAVGLRPISALVDITNLVMLDRNRPLHVFDADKLTRGIVVRMGRPGEKLLALDGRTYELTADMCVIADEAKGLGLGGIMGGEETGCTDATVNVFVESALFDPITIARTGRDLGILSDARYRFERGIDPASTLPGSELATKLILELCGGEPSELVIAGAVPDTTKTVTFRPGRVASLGGLDLPAADSVRILTALGFKPTAKGDVYEVAVPSWRPDVDGEADLVEEVLRVHGYDAIPPVPMLVSGTPMGVMTPRQKRLRMTKRTLASRGLREAVTWSFLSYADAELFGGIPKGLKLANPISADLDTMRPSLLPNLVRALARNADRGFANAALFEVAGEYHGTRPEDQVLVAAGVRGGLKSERHWGGKPAPVDAFDAKADALALLAALGAPVDSLQTATDAPAWYHPGRSGTLKLGPKAVLARFGELHPQVAAKLDMDGPVAAFEVFLDAIPLPKAKTGRSRGPLKASDYQMVERDFAFVVDRAVTAEDILKAARGADKALIRDTGVFDLYEGPGIAEGKKSVAITVRLQADDRTLTEAEIEAVAARIVAAVAQRTGAVLRT